MKWIVSFMMLILVTTLTQGQDTILISSITEYTEKLQLYKDSLHSYNIGKSVSNQLLILFNEMSKSSGNLNMDYTGKVYNSDSYFQSGWDVDLIDGQIVDTNTQSTFEIKYDSPKSIMDEFKLSEAYRRLDSCKVNPYGIVSAGEMPVIYIYKKPTKFPVYKAPCFSTSKKVEYSIIDITTYFIVDNLNRTRIPYNKIFYYGYKGLIKIEWIDPISRVIIKTIEINSLH